jgi:ABC-type antimicrobial peptide transport system ATPase subunit
MFTLIKRLFGINRRFRTESHTTKAGPFSFTVTLTTELATLRQIDFLRRLSYDGKELSKDEASLHITRILRPIDYAIRQTFKSAKPVKEHLRTLQIAISHSEYLNSLSRYGPNSTWHELECCRDPHVRLTKE